MADSAPAATSTARAIRLIPLSAPHELASPRWFSFPCQQSPSKSQLIPNFLVAAIVEHSNQKMALFPCGMHLAIWAIVGLRLSLC